MHELSLIADLISKIETIAHVHGAGKVTGVKVSIGALAHISGEHLLEHFIEAARGTVAEAALLKTETLTDITDPHAQEILLVSVDIED